MEWIKVTEEKPPEGVSVAILHESHLQGLEPYVLLAKFYPAKDDDLDDSWSEQNTTCGCCQWFESDSVTHWSWLPEVPQSFFTITREDYYKKSDAEKQKLLDENDLRQKKDECQDK